ncbi:MAG: 2-C-methyl-D-erythritol 4-phosphate cytidylyltransferase [bacterium]|nr:2-C-methyl-D-erythritol 4-phosphate cytidylyltransferase [bacterium]
MKVTAIIVAAGLGKRMGENIPKQYLDINGKPLIYYTLHKIAFCSKINDIILVVAEDKIHYCLKEIIEKYRIPKIKEIIAGGEKRQDSVYHGLKKVDLDTEIVLIHDGVRPLVDSHLLEKIILKTIEKDATVIGKPISDTIVRRDDLNYIKKILNRKNVYALETPQCFKYGLIMQAYQKAYQENYYETDDTSLVVRMGRKVAIIESDKINIKVTHPKDLYMAEYLLSKD